MRQRAHARLRRADRGTISRWWRLMLPVVVIVVLALLAADKAHQKLWPTAPSMQAADESSQAPRQIGLAETRNAR
jgi:uncharacterized membrane protein YqhA